MIVMKRIIAQDRGPSMTSISTTGLDIAKDVFQVRCIAADQTVTGALNRRDFPAALARM